MNIGQHAATDDLICVDALALGALGTGGTWRTSGTGGTWIALVALGTFGALRTFWTLRTNRALSTVSTCYALRTGRALSAGWAGGACLAFASHHG
ncbi:MAG: hypothetical protein OXU48_02495 [candidate division Zixibacteria bacterium]|nr:hypothetical protein [candidate division Zixibacteria bacterium]MDE2848289.1 hypothetical protein [Gemmatimonadota bacterium]